MAHSTLTVPRILAVLTALALGAVATGCGDSDETGGGEGGAGGAGGESSGEGGAGGGTGPESCPAEGSFRPCSLPDDMPDQPSGGQQCVANETGELAWNECQVASTAASTPLVLSFDNGPVTFAAGLASFDLAGTMSVVTDWPAASTPWLALDRDGNGHIDDGGELFGSATRLHGGARASNGFEALAELDSDGDRRITPADAAWSSLRLWSDADGDRVSSARELTELGARRLLSIELGYTSSRRCDLRGNCEIERATFRFTDESGAERSGTIVDIHLKHR